MEKVSALAIDETAPMTLNENGEDEESSGDNEEE